MTASDLISAAVRERTTNKPPDREGGFCNIPRLARKCRIPIISVFFGIAGAASLHVSPNLCLDNSLELEYVESWQVSIAVILSPSNL